MHGSARFQAFSGLFDCFILFIFAFDGFLFNALQQWLPLSSSVKVVDWLSLFFFFFF